MIEYALTNIDLKPCRSRLIWACHDLKILKNDLENTFRSVFISRAFLLAAVKFCKMSLHNGFFLLNEGLMRWNISNIFYEWINIIFTRIYCRTVRWKGRFVWISGARQAPSRRPASSTHSHPSHSLSSCDIFCWKHRRYQHCGELKNPIWWQIWDLLDFFWIEQSGWSLRHYWLALSPTEGFDCNEQCDTFNPGKNLFTWFKGDSSLFTWLKYPHRVHFIARKHLLDRSCVSSPLPSTYPLRHQWKLANKEEHPEFADLNLQKAHRFFQPNFIKNAWTVRAGSRIKNIKINFPRNIMWR